MALNLPLREDDENEYEDMDNIGQATYSMNYLIKLLTHRFDGDPKKLNAFVVKCSLAFKLARDNQKEGLLHAVLSKLDDPALTQLTNTEYGGWEELKEKLNALYKEKKSHAQLLQELNNIKQNTTEKVPEFFTRLEAAKAEIIKGVRDRENNPDRLAGIVDNVNEVTLNRFIYFSLPMISCVLRWRKPANLQEAYNVALEEEREMHNLLNRDNKEIDKNYQSFYDTLKDLSLKDNGNKVSGKTEGNRNKTYYNNNYNNNNNNNRNGNPRYQNNYNKTQAIHYDNNYNQARAPNRSDKICFTCGKRGHISPECYHNKNKVRTYNVQTTPPKSCKYCKKIGHVIDECFKLRNRKMYENNGNRPHAAGNDPPNNNSNTPQNFQDPQTSNSLNSKPLPTMVCRSRSFEVNES